jgi:hypothetical protein
MAFWGIGPRDPAEVQPRCWDSHLLRSNESEDRICTIDAKDASPGSGGNTFEITCHLNKRLAAGVKVPDMAGRIDNPNAIPARRNLNGIPSYAVHCAGFGIVTKNVIRR